MAEARGKNEAKNQSGREPFICAHSVREWVSKECWQQQSYCPSALGLSILRSRCSGLGRYNCIINHHRLVIIIKTKAMRLHMRRHEGRAGIISRCCRLRGILIRRPCRLTHSSLPSSGNSRPFLASSSIRPSARPSSLLCQRHAWAVEISTCAAAGCKHLSRVHSRTPAPAVARPFTSGRARTGAGADA